MGAAAPPSLPPRNVHVGAAAPPSLPPRNGFSGPRRRRDARLTHRRYFGALFTVYALSDAEGFTKYGPAFRSAAWLVREHLAGAADRSCDHWHDDAGFLNHHVGITWQLENALRAIDATTAAHYWDYTVDAANGSDWRDAVVFGDDWFSPATSSTNAKHIVDKGRWAFTRVVSCAVTTTRQSGLGDRSTPAPRKENPSRRLVPAQVVSGEGYSNVTNPFGLLRSPWNVNNAPFLMRRDAVLGDGGDGYDAFPSCDDFSSYVTKNQTLAALLSALNGRLHGPVPFAARIRVAAPPRPRRGSSAETGHAAAAT